MHTQTTMQVDYTFHKVSKSGLKLLFPGDEGVGLSGGMYDAIAEQISA
jgi:hypothetical protein